jgi:nicotinate-nucleotide adenylyltransferase
LRVGILGGVFNPPHIGHLICAQEALINLELDRVELMPVREAPHRTIEADPGPETRLAMCEAAVGGAAGIAASRLELDRPGPSYTVDTLRLWNDIAPDDELVLVLGSDQAASLPEWREPEEVLRLASVAVAEREPAGRERVAASTRDLPGSERIRFFEMPRIEVSSTTVRRRVADGLPIRWLVPEAVERLIAERGLYGAAATVGRS